MDKNVIYELFPSHYDLSEKSNNKFLLDTSLAQLEEIETTINNIYKVQDIDTANGIYLDKIGEKFGIKRAILETDFIYRVRIKTSIFDVSGDATVTVLYETLKNILESEDNIILFKEGIRPATKSEDGDDIVFEFKSFDGNYTKNFVERVKKKELNEIKYKAKGGYIYIVLNNKVPYYKRKLLIETLNKLKAIGVKIIFEFKYKINTMNNNMGLTLMGVHTPQPLNYYLFDNVVLTEQYDTNVNAVGMEANIKAEGR